MRQDNEKMCLVAQSLFVTPRTVAHQALLSMGILQARILEWVDITSSKGSSQPRDGPLKGLPHLRWVLYYLSHQGNSMR